MRSTAALLALSLWTCAAYFLLAGTLWLMRSGKSPQPLRESWSDRASDHNH